MSGNIRVVGLNKENYDRDYWDKIVSIPPLEIDSSRFFTYYPDDPRTLDDVKVLSHYREGKNYDLFIPIENSGSSSYSSSSGGDKKLQWYSLNNNVNDVILIQNIDHYDDAPVFIILPNKATFLLDNVRGIPILIKERPAERAAAVPRGSVGPTICDSLTNTEISNGLKMKILEGPVDNANIYECLTEKTLPILEKAVFNKIFLSNDNEKYYKLLSIETIIEDPEKTDQCIITIKIKGIHTEKKLCKTNVFIKLDNDEDNIYNPFLEEDVMMPFDYTEFKSSDFIVFIKIPNGNAWIECNISDDPANEKNYIVTYIDPQTQKTITQSFQKGVPNQNILLQKIKSTEMIVFTPFDYKHFESYKSMYYVFFVINNNILIKIEDFNPTADLKEYYIKHKPISFIETDQFFGYLPDYDFDVKKGYTGYYNKNADHNETLDNTMTVAKNEYVKAKEEFDEAKEKLRNSYKDYYELKKRVHQAINEEKNAQKNLAEATTNAGIVGLTIQEKQKYDDILAKATQESIIAAQELRTAQQLQELSEAEHQTYINEKTASKNKLDAAHNAFEGANTTIKAAYITKTVSKQKIFLVNIKYLKQSEDYILINYKEKYKINPFVNKNITNFDFNIYNLYKTYPTSCKIFLHNYDYPISFMGKQAEKILENNTIIRIEEIDLISKEEEYSSNIEKENIQKKLQETIVIYEHMKADFDLNIINRPEGAGVIQIVEREKTIKDFTKLAYELADIYTKLADYEEDFKEKIKYLDEAEKIYNYLYSSFKKVVLPEGRAADLLNNFDSIITATVAAENTAVAVAAEKTRLKNQEDLLEQDINNEKRDMKTTLDRIKVNIENQKNQKEALIKANPDEPRDAAIQNQINNINTEITRFETDLTAENARQVPLIVRLKTTETQLKNQKTLNLTAIRRSEETARRAALLIQIPRGVYIMNEKVFIESIIKMANFIIAKYQIFLKNFILFSAQAQELGEKSEYYNEHPDKDNNDIYEELALQCFSESQEKHDIAVELIDKLDESQIKLKDLYNICIVITDYTFNLPRRVDDNNIMLYTRALLLNILGNISETQGLISEGFVENFSEALSYCLKAGIFYFDACNQKELCRSAFKNEKAFLSSLYSSRNDKYRNLSNTCRLYKKQNGFVKGDDTIEWDYVYTHYKTVLIDRLSRLNSDNIVLFKIFYDYAMFLIGCPVQNQISNLMTAGKYLQKADDGINKKVKGGVITSSFDTLVKWTGAESLVLNKELGPYNLLVMNIKRELGFVVKTLEPEKYFYLFDNKPTSYSIEYSLPQGDSQVGRKIKDKCDSKFLFLEYSYQTKYYEDTTIPIPITKMNNQLLKPIDNGLFDAYNKEPLLYTIIYNDSNATSPDIFISEILLLLPSAITSQKLKSALIKPTIGGGKKFQVIYYDNYGNIKTDQQIDEKSLSIVKISQYKLQDRNKKLDLFLRGISLLLKPFKVLGKLPKKLSEIKLSSDLTSGKESSPTISYEKKTTPEIVPNELKISINTSIPGAQKIMYNPKMTIRDTSETTIRFNPLVKLDNSVINNVPKDLRIKQFFNKSLFDSLINFHGMEKARNLIQAMNEGIINNNIFVTLKTIFAVNTPMYINGEVYYIADVQWTPGDWTIDTKEKPVNFDMSKIRNPYMYSALVNDDIISGQEQIKNLPQAVLTGPNYKGPPPQANTLSMYRGLTSLQGGPVTQATGLQPYGTQAYGLPGYVTPGPQLIAVKPPQGEEYVKRAEAPIKTEPTVKKPNVESVIAKGDIINPAPKMLIKNDLVPTSEGRTLEPSRGPIRSIKAGPLESGVPRIKSSSGIEILDEDLTSKRPASNEGSLIPSITNPNFTFKNPIQTRRLRDIFARQMPNFFGNMDTLFKVMKKGSNDNVDIGTAVSRLKNIEHNISWVDTDINSDSLSKAAYYPTVGGSTTSGNFESIGLRICDPEENEKPCDSFFISVSKAMNQYNYNNSELNKIGKTQEFWSPGSRGVSTSGNREFTTKFLRNLVFEFLSENRPYLNYKMSSATEQYTIRGVGLLDRNTNILAELNADFAVKLQNNLDAELVRTPATNIRELVDGDYIPAYKAIYNKTLNSVFNDRNSIGPVPTFGIIKNPVTNYASIAPFIQVNIVDVDLKTYIMGDEYWGDEVAICALNIKLGLNIIVLRSKTVNFARDGVAADNRDLLDILNSKYYFCSGNSIVLNDGTNLNLNLSNWSKFVFLYLDNSKIIKNYYSLITFTYNFRNPITKKRELKPYIFTIFKKNNIDFSPPLYILYTIFNLIYLPLGNDEKVSFIFYPEINKGFNSAILSLLSEPAEAERLNKRTFFDNLYQLFKTNQMRALLDGARHMSGFIRDIPQFPGETPLKQVVGGRNNDYNRRDYNRRDYDYNRRDIRDNYFLKRDPIKDASKMGYYITIDMELKKGSPLSQEEIKESKCSQKWNTVRKAFANFTGRTYTIPPVYDYSNKKTSKNRSNIKPNNITRNNSRPNVRAQTTNNVVNPNKKLGGTRKNEEMKKNYLGKHSKTIKKMTN